MDYELLSTEKYEIYFQSSKLNDESYRRIFENTIYNILKEDNHEDLNLHIGLCKLMDLSDKTPQYEIHRNAYKIEIIRLPEDDYTVGFAYKTKFLCKIMEFIAEIQKRIKDYDKIIVVLTSEKGVFTKVFTNEDNQ